MTLHIVPQPPGEPDEFDADMDYFAELLDEIEIACNNARDARIDFTELDLLTAKRADLIAALMMFDAVTQ